MKRTESEFLPELARLKKHIREIKETALVVPPDPEELALNPCLYLLSVHWKNLAQYLQAPDLPDPEPGEEFVIIWKHPGNSEVRAQTASPEELLILKMIAEGIDRREIATLGAVPVGAVDAALGRAVAKGIVLAPRSRLRRNLPASGIAPETDERFLTSPTFTLQWHLTQACDLHCRHCYDRSARATPTLPQALGILDDLEDFCDQKHVRGRVSFTGGNPLLHPDFPAIYRAAAERGFTPAILGNPAPRAELEHLIASEPPDFYQVSLEGLPEYNDYIRGQGHFGRVMDFLELLRELGIYSMVMLTLTKDNLPQVLPLGELLREKADIFYFNRLALVGAGAALALPVKEDYILFLATYLEASAHNRVLGWKDNLLNILLTNNGASPFGGCTGFGCGAAFNFLAVLPDGEVHACRKFPSPVGNIFAQGLAAIYEGDRAGRYRAGCAACAPCSLKPVCGGCLASAYSQGLNIFAQKDPYCFL